MAANFIAIEECRDTQPFAECRGVDLAAGLNSSEIQLVRNGLLKHGLLLFRNQHKMTPEAEVRFNEAFGWHDPDQDQFLFGFGAPSTEHQVSGGAQMPELPQVSVLGNVFLENYHGIMNTQLVPRLGFTYAGWHADGLHDMYDGAPELTTMFSPPGRQAETGGSTYFTSGVRAVERMDPGLVEELEQCVVAYMRCPNDVDTDESRRVAPGPSFMIDEGTRRIGFAADMDDPDAGLQNFQLIPEHANAAGRHRCIREHPETGEKSLYVTPARAVYLQDIESGEMRHDIEETEELLSRALKPSAEPDIRYEHQWQQGDFIAWINTLVLHSASDPVEIRGERLMHRVRLSSPKKRWKNGSYLTY